MQYSAFVFTVITEWLLFSLVSRYALKLTFVFILLLNLVTWPVITWLWNSTSIPLPLLELGVWLVETIIVRIHWFWSWQRALVAAFLINAGSWGLGTLVNYLFFA